MDYARQTERAFFCPPLGATRPGRLAASGAIARPAHSSVFPRNPRDPRIMRFVRFAARSGPVAYHAFCGHATSGRLALVISRPASKTS
jgi:hypothetical protein